jgi:hypothetical protein
VLRSGMLQSSKERASQEVIDSTNVFWSDRFGPKPDGGK